MSWFSDNSSALAEAGISEADARDFLSRNEGDEHRVIEALTNYTVDRDYDSQGPEINNGNGSRAVDDGRRDDSGNRINGGGGGGNSLGNWSNATTTFDYKPFTEQFVAPTAPSDLMTPWTRTFTPTARPADLGEKWDKTYTRPTATDLYTDPGYEARMRAGNQGAERSAAARGTLLTGGFQKALGNWNSDYASNEYQRLADRSLGEYMNAFNTFTTDKGRRAANADTIFGQELSGYQTDFKTDQADKARRGAEFGNTYNRALGEYGQRFNIDTANQLNKYGIVTGDRNYGLAKDAQNFSIFDTKSSPEIKNRLYFPYNSSALCFAFLDSKQS